MKPKTKKPVKKAKASSSKKAKSRVAPKARKGIIKKSKKKVSKKAVKKPKIIAKKKAKSRVAPKARSGSVKIASKPKAKPKAKKSSKPKKVVVVITPEKLETILKKGKSRGFITFSEILSYFPNIEENITELEDMFAKFEQSGIELKDSKGYLEAGVKEVKKKGRKRASTGKIDSVQSYLREIGKIHPITAREEKELAKRIELGDMDAKRKLAEANLRLVVSIAKKYIGRSPYNRIYGEDHER